MVTNLTSLLRSSDFFVYTLAIGSQRIRKEHISDLFDIKNVEKCKRVKDHEIMI